MTTAAVGERQLRDLGVSNTGHDLPSFFFYRFLHTLYSCRLRGKGALSLWEPCVVAQRT